MLTLQDIASALIIAFGVTAGVSMGLLDNVIRKIRLPEAKKYLVKRDIKAIQRRFFLVVCILGLTVFFFELNTGTKVPGISILLSATYIICFVRMMRGLKRILKEMEAHEQTVTTPSPT